MINVFKNVFLSVKTHNKLLVFCSLSEVLLTTFAKLRFKEYNLQLQHGIHSIVEVVSIRAKRNIISSLSASLRWKFQPADELRDSKLI